MQKESISNKRFAEVVRSFRSKIVAKLTPSRRLANVCQTYFTYKRLADV